MLVFSDSSSCLGTRDGFRLDGVAAEGLVGDRDRKQLYGELELNFFLTKPIFFFKFLNNLNPKHTDLTPSIHVSKNRFPQTRF